MDTKTHFPFSTDIWDDQGNNIERHVTGVDDFETAVAPIGPPADDGRRRR